MENTNVTPFLILYSVQIRNRINSIKYGIMNRNKTLFLIPYSGQIRSRND